MTYAGGHWVEDGCSIEAYARHARQQEWRDRGVRDRRAGLPFSNAAKIKVKGYRRSWKLGWEEEDERIANDLLCKKRKEVAA